MAAPKPPATSTAATIGAPPRRRPGVVVAGTAIVGAMILGSVVMWVGIPIGLLWIASQLQSGTRPTLGPYLVVLFGLPLAMWLVAMGLKWLDLQFSRVTGYNANETRVPLPWLRSMRGERGSSRKTTILDVVMVVSIIVAGTGFAVWFFLFAGSSLPQ